MGLLSKLKSLFGLAEEDGASRGDVDVTVEREPSEVAESERAVTEPVAGGAVEEDEPQEEEPAATAETEPAAPEGPAAEPVQSIKGVGPSYEAKLADAGVDRVGDLVGADAEALADATGLSAKRISRWIEQAEARTSQ